MDAEKSKIGELLNFDELFRVKGKQGLFTVNSKVNKSGMVNVIPFLDHKEKYTVKATNLICLGHLYFQKMDAEVLQISDVFNNYEKYLEKRPVPKITPEIMGILVPDYDPYNFKDYHAKQIVKWYDEIIFKIEQNEKET